MSFLFVLHQVGGDTCSDTHLPLTHFPTSLVRSALVWLYLAPGVILLYLFPIWFFRFFLSGFLERPWCLIPKSSQPKISPVRASLEFGADHCSHSCPWPPLYSSILLVSGEFLCILLCSCLCRHLEWLRLFQDLLFWILFKCIWLSRKEFLSGLCSKIISWIIVAVRKDHLPRSLCSFIKVILLRSPVRDHPLSVSWAISQKNHLLVKYPSNVLSLIIFWNCFGSLSGISFGSLFELGLICVSFSPL